MIVELKQWQTCGPADADDLVSTRVGGRDRDVLHPSVQVGQYRQYLTDSHSAFHDRPGNVRLEACCYLHNYSLANNDALLAPKFDDVVRRQPLFDAAHSEALSTFLSKRLEGGAGKESSIGSNVVSYDPAASSWST